MSKRTIIVLAFGSILALVVGIGTALAVSLSGSNFEIDNNANLKVDGTAAAALDWANVAETRKADKPTGSADDSFGNGSKEDTPVPSVVDGSIPPNKSDLLNFGTYLETNANGRFLNVFWHRVQEPSGTTNMDFEFNQSSTLSANGVTPVRTAGDVLIQYDLSQGGTNPQLFLSRWLTAGPGSACEASNSTPCWSDRISLSAAGDATGSINTTAIPAGESDGLGPVSARTFGEAQIDFDALSTGSGCTSFGSAYLKSRSSDSFTAAMKDFIAPAGVNLNNCATVIIRKETTPEENPNATNFGFTKNFPTAPASANTFTLQDDGNKSFTNVVQGTGYTVDEDVIPTGWDLQNIDCNVAGHASSGVTPTISVANGTVSFAIDSPSDVLDCTYTNRAKGTIIVEKITDDGEGAFDFTSNTLPGAPFTLTTTDPGAAGKASRTFSNLAPSTYDVTEDVPDGWNLVSSNCSDSSDPSSIGLSAGETVTCTFHDAQERGTIIVEKITDDGEGAFDFTSNTLPGAPFTLTTTDPGAAGKDSETFSNLLVGTYDVAETVPDGWNLVSEECDDGSDPQSISLEDGQTVTCTFHDAQERGSILVSKVDGGGNPLAGAEFALDGDGDAETTGDQTPIPPVEGQDGLFCVDGLLLGDYNVVETVTPTGYTPEDPVQDFTVDSESTCAERTGETPDESDLEFVNIRNPGAILITKNAKDVNAESGGSSALAGVSFTVTGPGLPDGGVITEPTDANGQTCLGGLTVGETYTVTESDVPTGFLVDETVTQPVEITDDAECGSGNEDTAGPFNNDPLSEIEVQFRSLAQNANGEDRTAATIDCEDANGALEATTPDGTPATFDDSSEEFTNLKEGTYNCTVVIDP